MSAELASTALGMRQQHMQQQISVALVKKAHDMQTETLEMLMQVALNAPPPGQGISVDKIA
ncbi:MULTISPECIES: putative motility protein [unclassified Devosia]|uniref:putative motility protein n=1 Tax=unclassified Devosia TaxID=196773 RepID=UPI00145DD339|nr:MULTISPECIES: putative motility protein [unclassified Devosia]MBJ6987664.1 putative motility protein [Devosia sp. MC521]MBJ7578675.1 putative motility protein [Devosia sp. MC532]QMW62348.1 putative motility protein [Devosia sp. MC521]